MKITTNKAVTILMLIMLIPFLFISICSFFYIQYNTNKTFVETLTRVTENAAQSSIEHQVHEIELLFQSIEGSLGGDNIAKFIAPTYNEINTLIPAIINSSIFFKAGLISDTHGNFKVYPSTIKLNNFKPTSRSWYPKAGIKDEIFFSRPYTPATKNEDDDIKMAIIVSMNIFDDHAEHKGNVALKLDLRRMSRILHNFAIPYNGQFKVAARDGNVIMHANSNEIFSNKVPDTWIAKATEHHGHFFDRETNKFVFYRTYNNPDWVAFTVVSYDSYHDVFYAAYILLFSVIATCSVLYLVIMLLCRIYFKRMLNILFMNIHGVEMSENFATLENISDSLIKKQKKLEAAEFLSTTDSLTELGTRRKFDDDMSRLIKKGHHFHLAIIDLDNFKLINDTFGHNKGDMVLQFVSQSGINIVASHGSLYRFGGEEITVLFPYLSYKECHDILEEWRLKICERKWREEGLHASFSCGLVAWKAEDTAEELLENADKLLYVAKHNGKNQIVGWEEAAPSSLTPAS
ncbi:sensor domain-containing diguanylate cyclase [Buttiauxella warmboldiae]|uniref:diguanylate cyclase n=1 Tax=Buttiauxella warmboldiae TaxID=82993 RepID=A0A3N5DX12_9ENTR|nr:diguanylate cyclase [Buttiauxella warmboldiae]RPH30220.1 sensor domain-containing diguanylate cyclase [Buttiauxella warmboldiae]